MLNEVGGSIVWNLDADLSKFRSGIESAKDEAKGLAKDFDKSESSISSSLKSAEHGSKMFAGALAVAGAAVATFGFKSVQAFNESEQVTARLTKLILNQKGATMENVEALQAQAKAMQGVTTFGDELVMVAQSQLATFDLSTEAIQKVIPGFLDMMAAEKGAAVSMEEMKEQANGLGKALVGQTDMLVRQGFIFTDLQKEILKTGNEQERLQVITDVMGKTYGGLAATLRDTFQGQMIVAKNTFGDFMELIGQAIAQHLVPLIKKFNEWSESIGGPEGMMRKLVEILKVAFEWKEVIVGVILFGLIPAFVALAAATWTAIAPLIPFIALGAAVGLAVKFMIDSFGGWGVTVAKFKAGAEVIMGMIQSLVDAFNRLKSLITETFGVPEGKSFLGQAKEGLSFLKENLLGFDSGGIVPGSIGEPRVAVVHGGETILPTHKSNGGMAGSNTFNFYVSEKVDMPFVLDQVQKHLGMKGLHANAGIS